MYAVPPENGRAEKMKKIALVLIIIVLASTSCRRFEQQIRTETLPEGELYQLAMQKFEEKAWLDAVAAFDRYERLYVNSEKIEEVRLKRADAHFNRGTFTGYMAAKTEYQQFIALYPNFPREDYLWFQIANCSVQQMLPADRDQNPTKTAIQDLELFINRYPDSEYVSEARELLNEAYKRLAEYNIVVGNHYYNRGLYASAAGRYKEAVDLNVALPEMEETLYRLIHSLAVSASSYHAFYKDAENSTVQRDQVIDFYKEKYRDNLFNARNYLSEYSSNYPGNSGRIADLRALINQVPEDDEQPAESAR